MSAMRVEKMNTATHHGGAIEIGYVLDRKRNRFISNGCQCEWHSGHPAHVVNGRTMAHEEPGWWDARHCTLHGRHYHTPTPHHSNGASKR